MKSNFVIDYLFKLIYTIIYFLLSFRLIMLEVQIQLKQFQLLIMDTLN